MAEEQKNEYGPELGQLVDEVRKLAGVVGERWRERSPEVYGHLTAAGGELLAAYRAAVAGHERRWSGPAPARSERIDVDGTSDKS